MASRGHGSGRVLEGALEVGFAALGPRNTDWNTNASHSLFSARTGFKYEAASWFAVQVGFGNFGFRIPVIDSSNDGPRSAIVFAYRLIIAAHDDELGGITQFYHLGVLSFDFVVRKRQRPPGSSGRRYEIH